MNAKRAVLRAPARQDIEAAVDHYRAEAGERVALGLVGALEQALRHVARHQATGSPCHGHALGLSGLRNWCVKRRLHLVFNVEREDHIDVWRLLRERDTPAWLAVSRNEGPTIDARPERARLWVNRMRRLERRCPRRAR